MWRWKAEIVRNSWRVGRYFGDDIVDLCGLIRKGRCGVEERGILTLWYVGRVGEVGVPQNYNVLMVLLERRYIEECGWEMIWAKRQVRFIHSLSARWSLAPNRVTS